MFAIKLAVDRVIAEGSFDAVIHLAAQVAVTTSVVDPRADFMINALGTFNVLDAVRLHCPEAVLHLRVDQQGLRQDRGSRVRAARQPLCLYSTGHTASARASRSIFCRPMAARRGRLINTRSISRGSTRSRQRRSASRASTGRASSAWRTRAGLPGSRSLPSLGRDITIFGDGKQVRDVLHVDDLLRAYEAAIRAPEKVTADRPSMSVEAPVKSFLCSSLVEMLEQRLRSQDPAASGTIGGQAISRSTSVISASSTRLWAGSPKSMSQRNCTAHSLGREQSHDVLQKSG